MQTQESLILAHLKRGDSINALQSLQLYGIMRLASRISDIRKKYPNLNIQVDTVHNENTKKRYASYKIITKEIQPELAFNYYGSGSQ